jgi:hypothetical protein
VLNDEVAGQLTAAGATIELQDVAGRRVQARVPIDRLPAVAQLPVVDAIRLPSYAQHRVGAATTEGDALLYANEVRAQYSLDGTGVRVGVVSDGLKGVFATGCTSNCGGVDNGPMATSDLPPAAGVRNASGVLTSAASGIVARSFRANGDLEGCRRPRAALPARAPKGRRCSKSCTTSPRARACPLRTQQPISSSRRP